ncbi:MAG: DUF3991 domain-containing protein, partial [Lentisphaerae bacterium]|nr:DUF3991 domain-containing protein [Lentisphaerota bacterium]
QAVPEKPKITNVSDKKLTENIETHKKENEKQIVSEKLKTTNVSDKKLTENIETHKKKNEKQIVPEKTKTINLSDEKLKANIEGYKKDNQKQTVHKKPKIIKVSNKTLEENLPSARKRLETRSQMIKKRFDHPTQMTVDELRQETDKFKKEINLSEFAASYGYALDTSESYKSVVVMRHETYGKINIEKNSNSHYLYYSYREDRGGSIIDFVKNHQNKTSYDEEIRRELRHWTGNHKPFVSSQSYKKEISTPEKSGNDRTQKLEDHAQMLKAFKKCTPVNSHSYLENERQIDKEILSSRRFKGCIYRDQRNNAIFPHVDQHHQVTAFEKRNVDWKQNSKGKKGLWVSKEHPSDKELSIFESPIDALSHYELKGKDQDHTRYVAFGGRMSEKQLELIKSAICKLPEGATVTIATDNDTSGKLYYQQIKHLVPDTYTLKKEIPLTPGRDWNEELKQHKKEIQALKTKLKTLKPASYNDYLEDRCFISYQTIQDDRFKNCILAAQKKDPLFPQADENAHPVFPQR